MTDARNHYVRRLYFTDVESHYQVDVNAFEVGDLGQSGVGAGDERSHGEDGGDAESDAGGRRVTVQPEGHPRQYDNETRRHVDLDDVVAETAHEVELARQPRIVACTYTTRPSVCINSLLP